MPEAIDGTIVLQELITIDQLPVITERLATLSQEIDAKIAAARAMPATNETIQGVKKVRAALNAEHKELEERRKFVKKSVLAPYEEFESAYKRYVSDKYKSADADLKTAIDEIENAVKSKKTEEVAAYFNEYAASKNIDFLTLEQSGIKVNLSTTVKSMKEDAKDFIDYIQQGIELINTQEHADEIHVEFRKSLNAAQSIKTVLARHAAIEAQRERQADLAKLKAAEAEAAKKVKAAVPPRPAPPPIAPPVAIDPPPVNAEQTYKVAFIVDATKDALSNLVGYMRINGIDFRQIPLKNIVESEVAKVG